MSATSFSQLKKYIKTLPEFSTVTHIGLELIDEYKCKDETQTIRESRLQGSCQIPNCTGTFDITFNHLLKSKQPYCKGCMKSIKSRKLQETSVNNSTILFSYHQLCVYLKENPEFKTVTCINNILLADFKTEIPFASIRDFYLQGTCQTQNCTETFDIRFRTLLENKKPYCKGCMTTVSREILTDLLDRVIYIDDKPAEEFKQLEGSNDDKIRALKTSCFQLACANTECKRLAFADFSTITSHEEIFCESCTINIMLNWASSNLNIQRVYNKTHKDLVSDSLDNRFDIHVDALCSHQECTKRNFSCALYTLLSQGIVQCSICFKRKESYTDCNKSLQKHIDEIVNSSTSIDHQMNSLYALYLSNIPLKTFIDTKLYLTMHNDNQRRKTRTIKGTFNLTVQDILFLIIKQKNRCIRSFMTFDFYTKAKHLMSIDRIDNNITYTLSNVQLVIFTLNITWLTNEKWLSMCYTKGEDNQVDFKQAYGFVYKELQQRIIPRTKEKIQEDITNQTKYCKKCSQVKPFSEYFKNKNSADKISSLCKECSETKRDDKLKRYDKESPFWSFRELILQLAQSCIQSSKRRQCTRSNEHHTEDITKDEMAIRILNKYVEQEGKCKLTGKVLHFTGDDWVLTVDRLDCSKGYFEDNIRLIIRELQCTEHEDSEFGHIDNVVFDGFKSAFNLDEFCLHTVEFHLRQLQKTYVIHMHHEYYMIILEDVIVYLTNSYQTPIYICNDKQQHVMITKEDLYADSNKLTKIFQYMFNLQMKV